MFIQFPSTCRGSLYECPYIQKYQDKLIKTNHDKQNKNAESWRKVKRIPSAKPDDLDSEKSKSSKNRMSDFKKEDKSMTSSSVTLVRSTRAQDLRSQCNRDLMKPKSVCEKTRGAMISPYLTQSQQQQQQKKKKNSSVTPGTNRSLPTPKQINDEKRSSGREKSAISQSSWKSKKDRVKDTTEQLQREKTRAEMNPKILNKKQIDDCGDRPEPKKSQTFFICKGPRQGEGDDVEKGKISSSGSSVDNSDSDYDEPPSPKLIPITHNDSFCLIVKSSQNWSTKKNRENENLFQPRMIHSKKLNSDEKGILKNSNRDLKKIDSVEKVDSKKIVRFSDELIRKRKVLRKYVRRKNKLQNTIAIAWYRKNKIFQKYLQVLKAKSVLHGNPDDVPENLKPFQIPVYIRERYEAEMLGIIPRCSKSAKGRVK